MERLIKGDVVVVPFPFSDLSTVKRRPALVVAAPGGDDVILCQITSQQIRDRYRIHFRDALLAATTIGFGIDTIITEDAHLRRIPGITAANPYRKAEDRPGDRRLCL